MPTKAMSLAIFRHHEDEPPGSSDGYINLLADIQSTGDIEFSQQVPLDRISRYICR
jgi:hypothetical protein